MTASPGPALSAEQPFPGLRPYGFGDHDYFFGREEQTFSLFRLLDRSQFIAVVGASGSGKSSLVRAGLLPLLEEEGKASGGRSWRLAQMHPGETPLGNLADCLATLAPGDDPVIAAARRDRIDFALRRSSFGLREALGEVESLDKASIVLVVDQFEELFRYAGAGATAKPIAGVEARWREETTHFIQLLLGARQDPTYDVHVIVTMRSDFIGDCARFHGLPEAISATQFLVPSLTRDQLEDAIRKPIKKAGATIDAVLVERLINDSDNDLDELPVLQHCLLRLWECAGRSPQDDVAKTSPRQSPPRHLTVAHYLAIGGLARALSMHAEEILAGLKGRELAVEQVFRALSELDKEGRAVRRALPFSQLRAETGMPEDALREVLDRFRADDCSFLVPSPAVAPALSPDTYVDVGHEALLRRWERVSAEPTDTPGQEPDSVQKAGWLRAEVEDGRLYRGLLALARSGGQASQATLPLDEVERLSAWWTARPRTAAWADRYGGARDLVDRLFERSRFALESERKKQEALVVAEREAAAARQRSQRRTIAGLTGGMTIALVLVGLAFWQWTVARAAFEQARKAAGAAFNMWASMQQSLDDKLPPGSTISDELRRSGAFDDLTAAAEESLALTRVTLATDPTNATYQLIAGKSLRYAGDILSLDPSQSDAPKRVDYYRQSVQMLENVVAQSANNTDYQRELSLSYDRLGDRLVAGSQSKEAEQAYRNSLAISEKLSSQFPGNQKYLNDAAISYEKIANILVLEHQASQAIEAYGKARDAWQKLVSLDPNNGNWQRGLTMSQEKIADLDSDSGEAIRTYRAALGDAEGLAAANPNNVQVQWDLLTLRDKIGDAFLAQRDATNAIDSYRGALSVMEKLAKSDPKQSGLQINLAMRHGRIADLLKVRGDLAGALQEYKKKQALLDPLATADPGNVDWQLDLAQVDRKIGDVLVAQGRHTDALAAYQLDLAIWERLAKANPNDEATQRGLLLANWTLAAQGDDPIGRLTFIAAALGKLDADKKLTVDEQQWLPMAQGQLTKLQQK